MVAALPMAAVTMAGAVMEGDDDGGNGNGGGCSGNSNDGSRSDGSGSGIGGGGNDGDNNRTMGTTIVLGSYVHHQPIANSQKWGSICLLKKMSAETMLEVNLYHIGRF